MSQNIAAKLAAVAIAVIANGIVLGGVYFLFDSRTYAEPTSAQCQSNATHMTAYIV